MAEDRSEREMLIRQIRQWREKRAENNIGQLRVTWAAVCVLILAAIACFLFLPDGNRLWGVLFLVLSAALVRMAFRRSYTANTSFVMKA